jgi:hypothetical protein
VAQTLLSGNAAAYAAVRIDTPSAPDAAVGLPATSQAATSTITTANTAGWHLTGGWELSDGPLTVELLDGFGRRVGAWPTKDGVADTVWVPATTLAPGTYTIRVINARAIEIHRQRVVRHGTASPAPQPRR